MDILHFAGLKSNGLTVDDIHYVVGTHGHSDHVGNNNLFKKSTHILGHDICDGDQYKLHDFENVSVTFQFPEIDLRCACSGFTL